jgi:hypothetical protein
VLTCSHPVNPDRGASSMVDLAMILTGSAMLLPIQADSVVVII